MKYLKFLILGILFGIILIKSEAASWYRIYEMFHFQSFHMYGIIGTSVGFGVLGIQFLKKKNIKDIEGNTIQIEPKEKGITRYLIGGILFGLGWGLVGTCPGPIFVLIGAGYYPIIIIFIGALAGTFLYGLVKDKLPH